MPKNTPEASPGSSIAAVQATNDDAAASKLSCVKKGYMTDDYVHLFVRRPVRRSPIINRGYYARWAALRKLLIRFLKSEEGSSSKSTQMKKQILSLGAGFDTTYFQLMDEGIAPHLYVELDFKEVTSKKAALIDHYSQLRDKLGPEASVSRENGEVLSDNYKVLPVDLRDIQKMDLILELAQLDPSLPTFIIAECVLIYMDPDSTRSIVGWASKTFSTAVFFLYEQIHPDDAFGEQMIKNLEGASSSSSASLDHESSEEQEQILQILLSIEGIDINAVNRTGETALGIAEKNHNEEITPVLRDVGAVVTMENVNPPSAAKHLNQTASNIKYNVQSQLWHARQTQRRVQRIRKRLEKLHLGGLNNAIISSNVVAVLIATVAFATLFTVPGKYVEEPEDDFTLGEAYIAKRTAFIIFLLFDSLALLISLAIVMVQTSIIVVERKAKKQMEFVINKLMWLDCLFISISFICVAYIVVSHKEWWLAWATVVIGASIMLSSPVIPAIGNFLPISAEMIA